MIEIDIKIKISETARTTTEQTAKEIETLVNLLKEITKKVKS